MLNQEIDKVKERSNAKLRAILGSTKASTPVSESMTFLIEVVSGRDLPISDCHKQSSDPFVICLFNEQEVHRTDVISSNLDPIWTVANGSLFLFTTTVEELFRSHGILCILYDYDLAAANDRLGEITIEPGTIYKGNGSRLEYKLKPPPGKTSPVPGYLAVRVRLATNHDKQFMYDLQARQSKTRKIEAANELQLGGASNIKSVMSRRQRKRKDGAMEVSIVSTKVPI
jgi:Ca2+-dependent lipid-binding protein